MDKVACAIENLAKSMDRMALCQLFDAGIITLDEARDLLGLPEVTEHRRLQLRRATNFTYNSALVLPGYALSEIGVRREQEPSKNEPE